MIINRADVIESIHTGNTFVVEYVSEDGNFFILHPKDGEKSRGYNIHELNRSFVKVPYVPLASEGDMIQPQNIPNNIPDGLAAAVNRLLDCDGTRGHFSAIRCGDAREEVERLLAQPVSSGYKLPEGWIACSERMPELDKRVLLYFGSYDGHIEDGCIGDDGDGPYHYFFDGDSLQQEPTHWMPLPIAPEGGNG
ncbi:DUF551 domain-containing protein [Serratia marcescens]|uniref:DUF551 domain-containing protein n=1 Tax=Serratia TaxID=613 RepID=UPI000C132423|nr:DUF551 domain-containing protein [Serratia marcescens]MDX6807916.1 DUF551 domain-containing protein [Serratia marcescens]PHY87881.1 hypothetical protein CS370_06350 [Serratia marcescens]HBC7448609.1 DUF551 domain-containing protein [Serratia marcescens]